MTHQKRAVCLWAVPFMKTTSGFPVTRPSIRECTSGWEVEQLRLITWLPVRVNNPVESTADLRRSTRGVDEILDISLTLEDSLDDNDCLWLLKQWVKETRLITRDAIVKLFNKYLWGLYQSDVPRKIKTKFVSINALVLRNLNESKLDRLRLFEAKD